MTTADFTQLTAPDTTEHRSQPAIDRSNRTDTRLLARLLATSLDLRLAEGRSSESSRLLAARARLLVAPSKRRALAQDWAHLVMQARTPSAMRGHRVPLNRSSIVAGEPAIRRLISALLASRPPRARGVAMARLLLSDGTGPLYDPRRSPDLGIALTQAISQLG